MNKVLLIVGTVALVSILASLMGCESFPGIQGASVPKSSAPSPDTTDVPLKLKTVWAGSYQEDIQPIFDKYCIDCHGAKKIENGLRLDSYEATLAGTRFGPVVAPGSAGTSALVFVIDGQASQQIQMPHQERKLSRNRIANIKAWIDAGAQK